MSGAYTGDPAGRLYGIYEGVVLDVMDPDLQLRVRASIPGLIEKTAWAEPLGLPGASSNRAGSKGFSASPVVGSRVGVGFFGGDLDRPFYLTGLYGGSSTRGVTDVPPETLVESRARGPGDTGPALALASTTGYETDNFVVTICDVSGNRRLVLRNKVNGDTIEMDAETNVVAIKATTALTLTADGLVDIRGARVTIQGRVVAPLGQNL